MQDICLSVVKFHHLFIHSFSTSQGSDCLKSIPIVIMSSENDPRRITRCEASGAEEFISKPLKTADIIRLKTYVRPPPEEGPDASYSASAVASMENPKSAGTKRKRSIEEDMNGSSDRQSRPRLARVTVV